MSKKVSQKVAVENVRQGDVLLRRVERVPEGAKKEKRAGSIVMALGETSGHMHAIEEKKVDVFVLNGQRWIVANEDSELKHITTGGVLTEEHDTVKVGRGIWEFVYQRQYTRGVLSRVMD